MYSTVDRTNHKYCMCSISRAYCVSEAAGQPRAERRLPRRGAARVEPGGQDRRSIDLPGVCVCAVWMGRASHRSRIGKIGGVTNQ